VKRLYQKSKLTQSRIYWLMGLQPMVQKNLTLNHFAFQQFQMDQIG